MPDYQASLPQPPPPEPQVAAAGAAPGGTTPLHARRLAQQGQEVPPSLPNDPFFDIVAPPPDTVTYLRYQWHLPEVQAPRAWTLTGGAGVRAGLGQRGGREAGRVGACPDACQGSESRAAARCDVVGGAAQLSGRASLLRVSHPPCATLPSAGQDLRDRQRHEHRPPRPADA